MGAVVVGEEGGGGESIGWGVLCVGGVRVVVCGREMK